MSRRRPYLNLKESILDLFRTTARWLHDSTSKESIFEKPYDTPEYRSMHLKLPEPSWPSTNPEGIDKRPKTWTYVWDPGICGLGTANPECGEEFTIPVSIGLLPPGTMIKSFNISAHSSNSDCIEILKVESALGETGGTIHCKAATECEDTVVTICAKASLVGEVRDTLQVPVPPPFDREGVLDYRVAASLPALIDTYRKTGFEYNCGCIDIPLDCCGVGTIAWDSGSSAEQVGQSSFAGVAITDTGNSGPYTWSLSGSGFYVDETRSKTVIKTENTGIYIYTDGDACGACTITVTNCDGSSSTVGYIASTAGQWGDWVDLCGVFSVGGPSNSCCEKFTAARKYKVWCRYGVSCVCPSIEDGCVSEGACLPSAFGFCCHNEGYEDSDYGTFNISEQLWECS